MTEPAVLRRIMLACCNGATRLFRNNIGAYKDKRGIFVRYGVANPGGSDLIGWQSVKVTPSMVGQTVAIFSAIEVKKDGKPTPEQVQFISAVKAAGGLAGVARSPEDADAILNKLPGQ